MNTSKSPWGPDPQAGRNTRRRLWDSSPVWAFSKVASSPVGVIRISSNIRCQIATPGEGEEEEEEEKGGGGGGVKWVWYTLSQSPQILAPSWSLTESGRSALEVRGCAAIGLVDLRVLDPAAIPTRLEPSGCGLRDGHVSRQVTGLQQRCSPSSGGGDSESACTGSGLEARFR
ncbi:unnamed protein product [Protopolystoma xenopodis]|uniref:Uncharacterized protein n=1 Tax=Protopolystoma xenopodis TaxID=117903 RepID=A0A448XE28_9PLAT|nr:unnamed protein product [Protopolystoma xenopodis]